MGVGEGTSCYMGVREGTSCYMGVREGTACAQHERAQLAHSTRGHNLRTAPARSGLWCTPPAWRVMVRVRVRVSVRVKVRSVVHATCVDG